MDKTATTGTSPWLLAIDHHSAVETGAQAHARKRMTWERQETYSGYRVFSSRRLGKRDI